MLRSSVARPPSEHTAISPLVRALAQLKLGLPPVVAGAVGAAAGGWADATGAAGCTSVDATGFVSVAAGTAWLTRPRVASGVTIASAFRNRTTGPLPSAA